MTPSVRGLSTVAVALCFGALTHAWPQQGAAATTRATGTFDITQTMQPPDGYADGAALGRATADKVFHGDLEGTSKGQMLTAGAPAQGSAAYVAIEKFTGTLHGRQGTFVLQHTGTITRGKPSLTVTVVPDSGTGQLIGLTGEMNITNVAGMHSYEFDYTLTKTP